MADNDKEYKFFKILKKTDDELEIELNIKRKYKTPLYGFILILATFLILGISFYFTFEPALKLLGLISCFIVIIPFMSILGIAIYYYTSKKFIFINKKEKFFRTKTIHGLIAKNKQFNLNEILTITINERSSRYGGPIYFIVMHFQGNRKKYICGSRLEDEIETLKDLIEYFLAL